MDRSLVAPTAALLLAVGGILSPFASSAAAEACKESSTVTVTGVILFAHLTESGWSILADNVTPCDVRDLVGRGPLPSACQFSKTLEATGSIGAGGLNMEVQTITCS